MIGKKINQLATELAPVSTDLTIIGDPISGVSKKITLAQLGAIFSGAVSFYTNLASFPAVGDINVIYCAKDTQKLYLWSGSAYVEVFPSQALLNTYQLRSEKGVSNGYASLDSAGKVPIAQLPSSIMEYKGTWNAATNTPTLANGTGDTGDVYICNVAGSVNFGAGAITFAVGDYVIYSGSIWQRSSGAVGTVTSVGVTRSGDALAITGSPITTSGTINLGFAGTNLQYINGAGNLITFPSLTGFVPYTGATANVDLGTFDLTADFITGSRGSYTSSGGGNTLEISHTSGSGIALNITKGGNGEGLYINKTSGSGNAATIIGTLNATTLVKSGGTSAQFLKADGSVDSTSYQPILTNPVTGTGASGQVTYFNGTSTVTGTNNHFWDATNNRLGIGTITPQRSIEIFNATADNHLRLSGNAPSVSMGEAVTGSIYQAKFGLVTTNGQFASAGVAGDFVIISQTGATIFVTNSTEKMRVQASGNMSVGNTNDTYRLDVTGTARFTGQLRLESTITDGTNTYTLPSATGTLALTSALSGYLPLTGGTLTGALSGTSATFSATSTFNGTSTGVIAYFNAPTSGGTITFQTGGTSFADIGSELGNFGTGSATNLCVSARSGNNLILGGGALKTLTLASTGAATFSSSVQTNSYFIATDGTRNVYINPVADFGAGALPTIQVASNHALQFATNNTLRLTIASTGAATFSSSVRLTGTLFANTQTNNTVLSSSDATNIANGFNLLGSSSYWGIRTLSNGDLSWDVYNSNSPKSALYIVNNGNVGIGTSSPLSILDVREGNRTDGSNITNFGVYTTSSQGASVGGTIALGGLFNGSSFAPFGSIRGGKENSTSGNYSGYLAFQTIVDNSSLAERMRITSGGNVGINTSSPSYTLDVNGTARFGSAIVASLGTGLVYSSSGTLTSTNPSDQRLKNTIKALSYGLNEVLQLNPKTFYYNDDVNKERLKYGFIAQEVKGIMPELARKLNAETDYLGLETEGIYVTLVNAIKELKAELDTLKNK